MFIFYFNNGKVMFNKIFFATLICINCLCMNNNNININNVIINNNQQIINLVNQYKQLIDLKNEYLNLFKQGKPFNEAALFALTEQQENIEIQLSNLECEKKILKIGNGEKVCFQKADGGIFLL